MNNFNQNNIWLAGLFIVILGFFFFNNFVHIGFHIGHSHDGLNSMMGDNRYDYSVTEAGGYDENISDSVEANESGAQIAFNRTIYDFGDIPQSQGIIDTTFEVINTGKRVLEIGELSTSCGCTTAEISNKSIQPSQKAILTVYFDPNFHKEPSDKLTRTVFIPSNDTSKPETEVKITVDILEDK